MAHGDLGIAFEGTRAVPLSNERTGQAVGPAVVHAAMVTGSVVLGGALFALLLSIPLGAIAASRPRSLTDRTILVVTLVGICTHPLVVALLLQQFPGRSWGLAPPGNYCPFFGTSQPGPFDFSAVTRASSCGGPTAWASHLILPWITFALFFLAIYTRLVRVRMIEVMDEPFIRTAAAKGASRSRVVRHHALRNAMSPVLTLVGMDVGLALGIALYIESVYRLPGLGLTTLGALSGGAGYDLPMILGVVLVIGVVIVVVELRDRPHRPLDGSPSGSGRHAPLGRRTHRLVRQRGDRLLAQVEQRLHEDERGDGDHDARARHDLEQQLAGR